jgi:hypothetical protein
MEGKDPWLDDPHTPKLVTSNSVSRYKLGAKNFDHRFQHSVLFGGGKPGEEIVRPRILDLTKYLGGAGLCTGDREGQDPRLS